MQIGTRCNRLLARDFASCRPTFKLFHICAGARRVSNNKCNASSDRDMVSNDIKKAAIVWIRNDVRLTDHAPVVSACSLPQTCFVVPVYCLSPALLQPRCNIPGLSGILVLGPHRCRFLLEALQALQQQLAARGSKLHFAVSRPAEEIPALVRVLAGQVSHVDLYHYLQIGRHSVEEEDAVADAFQAACKESQLTSEVHHFWGHTLYHPHDALAALKPSARETNSQMASAREDHDDVRFNDIQALYTDVPHVMTNFRKAVEGHGFVREPLPAPDQIPPFPDSIPSAAPLPEKVRSLYKSAGAEAALAALEQLTACPDLASEARHPRSAFCLEGGELEGLKRLRYYLHGTSEAAGALNTAEPAQASTASFGEEASTDRTATDEAAALPSVSLAQEGMTWEAGVSRNDSEAPDGNLSAPAPIDTFKDTRMLAGGVDNSAKLSAYLAAGCLSPRMVYAEIQKARSQSGGDSGHSWLIMHLIIRDFFLFTALKEGDKLERPEGIRGEARHWRHSDEEFLRWCQGRTGFPFVDACMRELAATGYMSNRGRQNVSSFLCKAMGHSWQVGAALFETLLVDHDWAVNTVNWAYFAGVGNDPRDRIFRTVSQGMTYDPEAQHINSWVPELSNLSGDFAHRPWKIGKGAAEACGFDLCRDYVPPLLDASTQIAMNYGKK